MIKPFLDSMSVQPTGGHTVFTANNVQSSSPPTPTADQSNIKSTSKSVTGQSPSAPPPHATSNTGQPTSSATAIEPTVYMEACILLEFFSSKITMMEWMYTTK